MSKNSLLVSSWSWRPSRVFGLTFVSLEGGERESCSDALEASRRELQVASLFTGSQPPCTCSHYSHPGGLGSLFPARAVGRREGRPGAPGTGRDVGEAPLRSAHLPASEAGPESERVSASLPSGRTDTSSARCPCPSPPPAMGARNLVPNDSVQIGDDGCCCCCFCL